jgi:hypothetical protein
MSRQSVTTLNESASLVVWYVILAFLAVAFVFIYWQIAVPVLVLLTIGTFRMRARAIRLREH